MQTSNKTKNKFLYVSLCVVFFAVLQTGCKKLVDVPPPNTSTNGANVFTNDATAAAVLTGIYTKMSQSSALSGNVTSISLFAGLSADELTLFNLSNTTNIAYYRNKLTPTMTSYWNIFYPIIFVTNSAIEGLTESNNLTPAVKQQLLGEARFMRAFCYFYLVNFFGDVPVALGTDFETNRLLSRTPKDQVWQQIIADLKDAQGLLSPNYLNSDLITTTSERVRPNKFAATALLARAYLYTRDYVNAEAQATNIISNSSFYSLTALGNTFLKNSTEAIWQLQPVNKGWNTENARVFNLSVAPIGLSSNKPVYINTSLLNSFESGDNRKTVWINTYTNASGTYSYPSKYKSATLNAPVTEYEMVLRLSEQFLIRAEARVKQNKLAEAQSDLNVIRNRAGLPNTTASTESALLDAILHEKQVELFTEWGHRWLDLKRTGNVDAVMSIVTPLKGGTWNTNWQLYPITQYELQVNPNLTQNAGYQ